MANLKEHLFNHLLEDIETLIAGRAELQPPIATVTVAPQQPEPVGRENGTFYLPITFSFQETRLKDPY